MKKIVMCLLLAMISYSLMGCSFFADKPSDSQIKKDVEEYFSSTYNTSTYDPFGKVVSAPSKSNPLIVKPLQINKIYIKGIVFIREKDVLSKVAVVIVRVAAEFKSDYKTPFNMSSFRDLLNAPKGLGENHKKGEIILFGIRLKYCRSDRAWLPYQIESSDIDIINESGEKK